MSKPDLTEIPDDDSRMTSEEKMTTLVYTLELALKKRGGLKAIADGFGISIASASAMMISAREGRMKLEKYLLLEEVLGIELLRFLKYDYYTSAKDIEDLSKI